MVKVDENLEKIIKQRKEVAITKNLSNKAGIIARMLGRQEQIQDNNSHSQGFIYTDDDITIICGRSGPNGYVDDYAKIKQESRIVLHVIGTFSPDPQDFFKQYVCSYIPGEWEERFESIYSRADKIYQQKLLEEKRLTEEREEKEKKEYLANFGL